MIDKTAQAVTTRPGHNRCAVGPHFFFFLRCDGIAFFLLGRGLELQAVDQGGLRCLEGGHGHEEAEEGEEAGHDQIMKQAEIARIGKKREEDEEDGEVHGRREHHATGRLCDSSTCSRPEVSQACLRGKGKRSVSWCQP